jgi:hypothetical protein
VECKITVEDSLGSQGAARSWRETLARGCAARCFVRSEAHDFLRFVMLLRRCEAHRERTHERTAETLGVPPSATVSAHSGSAGRV